MMRWMAHNEQQRRSMDRKKTQWDRLIHTLEKYNKESERLEADTGYKTPPPKTVHVRTTKRVADLINSMGEG
jgi:hypothetical protein